LEDNYFSDNSFFEYQSDYINISYKGKDLQQTINLKKSNFEYQKSKNIYIPAERNFVSVIPNLNRYNETNDNIMSFVYDWSSAGASYTKQNKLPILNLNIDFYIDDEKFNSAVLFLREKNKEIFLRSGSSGLQSIVPLIVIIEYLTYVIYTEEYAPSVNELKAITDSLSSKDFVDFVARKSQLQEEISEDMEKIIKKIVDDVLVKRKSYYGTNFIIEEPEQNLFPETQRDLVYYLLEKCSDKNRDHQLTITTHSPYILYALNNCMLGHIIKDNMPAEEQQELLSKRSWIDPNLVSIWQIEQGTILPIKNSKTGTVSKHYFNEIMNDVMEEYYDMLTYLKPENNEE
jgi:hypothetical protein